MLLRSGLDTAIRIWLRTACSAAVSRAVSELGRLPRRVTSLLLSRSWNTKTRNDYEIRRRYLVHMHTKTMGPEPEEDLSSSIVYKYSYDDVGTWCMRWVYAKSFVVVPVYHVFIFTRWVYTYTLYRWIYNGTFQTVRAVFLMRNTRFFNF